jgi:hypothetical protein
VHANDVESQKDIRLMQDIEFEASSTLMLRFNGVYDRRYLCGITFNGHTIGYDGDFSTIIQVEKWTGLRLVSDNLGFVSVHVRDLCKW